MALIPHSTAQGFTLIEVLIALSITFLSATALFAGYRTAIDTSARATASMQVTDQQTLLRDSIKTALLQQHRSGQLQLSDTHYHWEVTANKRLETVLGFDAEELQTRFSGRYAERFDITLHDAQDRLLTRFVILLSQP